MMKIDLLDYKKQYQAVKEKHEELNEILKTYPSWLLDKQIGDSGDTHIADLLEQQGLDMIDLTSGEPITLIEWLENGYYSVDLIGEHNGEVAMFWDYMDSLDDYIRVTSHLIDNLDYSIGPIGYYDQGLKAYDIIYGIEDFLVAGYDLQSSRPYKVNYTENGDPYILYHGIMILFDEILKL